MVYETINHRISYLGKTEQPRRSIDTRVSDFYTAGGKRKDEMGGDVYEIAENTKYRNEPNLARPNYSAFRSFYANYHGRN